MTDLLRVALITLGDPGRLTGGYLYHRRMAELAPRFGARVDFVSFPDWPFPLAASRARSVLARAGRLRARVLLLDSIAAAFLGGWLLRNAPPVPLVGMAHQPPGGIDHNPARERLQAILDRAAYRRARRLLVASDDLAAHFRAQGFPPPPVRVIPPGRDVAAAMGMPPGDLRRGRRAALLSVGNWVERKGTLELLDALARLPDGAATLHLAGDEMAEPAYGRRVERRLAEPDLARRVVRHGAVPVEDVAALYVAADAFVLPSYREPFGTVYGEAMNYGLPVVGWRAGNLPHLADDDVEGLIVEPGDVDGLARAMLRLVEDEPLRRRLGEAARRRAEERPTWAESAALLFETLREVVAGR